MDNFCFFKPLGTRLKKKPSDHHQITIHEKWCRSVFFIRRQVLRHHLWWREPIIESWELLANWQGKKTLEVVANVFENSGSYWLMINPYFKNGETRRPTYKMVAWWTSRDRSRSFGMLESPPHGPGLIVKKGVFYKNSVFHLGKQRGTLRST